MKDFTRESLARHLFDIMNQGNKHWNLDSTWKYYVEHGWHNGYLRLADEVISKGYKP